MQPCRLLLPPLALAALAACGPGQNDPGPGGVTVSEAQALDDAAEMLEERKLPPGALPAPAAEAPSPVSPPEPQR